MPCRYNRSLTLPRGAIGWSVECDRGISWSYSLFNIYAVFQYLVNTLPTVIGNCLTKINGKERTGIEMFS